MAVDREYIERLANERFQGEFRREFIAALDELQADFPFERIVAMIEAGDIEGAVEAVGLTPERFAAMAAVTGSAVAAAATATAGVLPPRERLRFAFQPGNPRAERAVDELNTGLMRGLNGGPAITEEGKKAVREHIRVGLQQGKNPREVARQMRGTWDPKAKAYRGGMIGLTDTQARHVRNAEAQLRSGDPAQMRRYLGRQLRDKRHDRAILRAINDERPLSAAQIDRAVNSYNRRYIAHRAEMVARDQSLRALTSGQEEGIDQMIRDGHVREEDVIRRWVTARDERVRNSHQSIPGRNRQGRRRGEAFITPLGQLRYPRDPQGTPADTIACRCTLTVQLARRTETVEVS